MARKNLKNVEHIEITVENDKPMASSLQIAKHFGKAHDNVLRDIRNLIKDLPKGWVSLNFEDISVSTDLGHICRQDPAYLLTRDGFTLLAMGFSGKKALQWKLNYISAFNAMEKRIREQELEAARSQRPICLPQNPVDEDPETRGMRVQKGLRGMLSYWAYVDEIPLEQAERTFCAYLGITNFSMLKPEHLRQGAAFLSRMAHQATDGGRAAHPELITIAKNLYESCAQFRYTRDTNVAEQYEGITEAVLPSLTELTEAGARKVIPGLWGLFKYLELIRK